MSLTGRIEVLVWALIKDIKLLSVIGQTMNLESSAQNERILSRVEELGGDYVWDRDVFAVTLMDVAIPDAEAAKLAELIGVKQIVLDSSLTSFFTLRSIAAIAGLESLVLCNSSLSENERDLLESFGPTVEIVEL